MRSVDAVKAPVTPAQLLIASVVGFGLVIAGFAVLLTPLRWLGLVMFASGLVLRIVVMVLRGISRWQAFSASPPVWWYHRRTRQVSEGRVAPGRGWDGPYASQEDAARAPEIARARAAEWNAEDGTQ